VLIEPVTGTVTLRGLTDAKSVRALALTAEGRPLSVALRGVRSQNGWTLKLGEPSTTWWVLEVER
jgi:hypothetical protein